MYMYVYLSIYPSIYVSIYLYITHTYIALDPAGHLGHRIYTRNNLAQLRTRARMARLRQQVACTSAPVSRVEYALKHALTRSGLLYILMAGGGK
jgi:hypothetical protein